MPVPCHTFSFPERGTARRVELTISVPDCRCLVRASDGSIQEDFPFSGRQLSGLRHGFFLGLGWFSFRDLDGHEHNYAVDSAHSRSLVQFYRQASEDLMQQFRETGGVLDANERFDALKKQVPASETAKFTSF